MKLSKEYKKHLHNMLDQNLEQFERFCSNQDITINEKECLAHIEFVYYIYNGKTHELSIRSNIEFDKYNSCYNFIEKSIS